MINLAEKIKQVWIWIWLVEKKGDLIEFKQPEEEKFAAAVEKLNAAAQTGKLEEIKAAYGETGATCKSCHDTFRGPE